MSAVVPYHKPLAARRHYMELIVVTFRQPTTDEGLLERARAVHHAWNAALKAKDVEGVLAL
ncbi:MAG TPA: hypothetical protein VH414_21110 [Lichenihabitans sp.]|nr:hypothetical protein [Lichenihabitans sp.]